MPTETTTILNPMNSQKYPSRGGKVPSEGIMGYRKTPHFQDQLELRGIDEMLVSLCIAKGRRHDARMRQKGVLALRLDHRQIVEAVLAGYVDPGNLGGVTAMFVVIKGKWLITVYFCRGDWGIGC